MHLGNAVLCGGHPSHWGQSCVHHSRGRFFCKLEWDTGSVPHAGTAEETQLWTFTSLQCLLDFKLLGPNLWINLILVSYMFRNVFYTGYEYFIKSSKACRHLHGKWIFKLKVLRGKGQEQTKFSQKVLPLQMKRKCSKLLWRPSRILHIHLKVYSWWLSLPLQMISCHGLYILTKIQSMCDHLFFFYWLVKQLVNIFSLARIIVKLYFTIAKKFIWRHQKAQRLL